MNKNYILPASAELLLKEAEKKKQSVYIFGMCGYGKSALVSNYLKDSPYLYFDMLTEPHNFLKLEVKRKTTVVIDNLGFLDDVTVKSKIIDILSNPLCWCILISRAHCPEWLISNNSTFATVCESDLAFSYDETLSFLESNGISRPNENIIKHLHEYSHGHPLFIKYASNRISSDRGANNDSRISSITESTLKLLYDYYDHELMEKWDDDIIDFAIKMSTVTSFNKPMAVEITGINNIEIVIDKANSVDSFLEQNNDFYSIRLPLRNYLRFKMYSLYSKDKIVNIYNIAGQYYKRHGQIMESYEMFEKAENKSAQLDILIENARLNPSDGYLTELKNAYIGIDEDTIKQHPELIAAVCMLYSLMLDINTSDYWYDILKEQSEILSGKSQKVAKRYLTYLDIACIHKPGKNVLQIFKNMFSTVFDPNTRVPEWALTCNGPTLMNGGRDFCEWSKKDSDLYAAMEIPFRKIFGKSGAGMPDLSLAESYFEKGGSDYEIMRLLSRGQMDANMRGRVELVFVAVGILAQLHLIHNHSNDAKSALIKFKNSHTDANPKLIMNVDMMLCRINLLLGNTDSVKEWLSEAPDENAEFNVLFRYVYMCKIRCYLSCCKSDEAYILINKMMYYSEICERTYIKMECLILMAILQYRNAQPEWDSTLCSALAMTEEYHFIRIITREGIAISDMLKQCSYQYSDSEYKKQLFEEVDLVSKMYPHYLANAARDEVEITDNALEILKLQAQGLSNDEIAQALFISINTVKYHCKENYRKLGVSNRLGAIAEAQKRGILP